MLFLLYKKVVHFNYYIQAALDFWILWQIRVVSLMQQIRWKLLLCLSLLMNDRHWTIFVSFHVSLVHSHHNSISVRESETKVDNLIKRETMILDSNHTVTCLYYGVTFQCDKYTAACIYLLIRYPKRFIIYEIYRPSIF